MRDYCVGVDMGQVRGLSVRTVQCWCGYGSCEGQYGVGVGMSHVRDSTVLVWVQVRWGDSSVGVGTGHVRDSSVGVGTGHVRDSAVLVWAWVR